MRNEVTDGQVSRETQNNLWTCSLGALDAKAQENEKKYPKHHDPFSNFHHG
jgi:hypothetical protein